MKILEYGRNRYVRWWMPTTQELSPPILLDRYTGRMRPYVYTPDARNEWDFRREQQLAIERQRQARITLGLQRKLDFRQAGLFGVDDFRSLIPFNTMTGTTVTTLALSSAYVAGTSGAAIGWRYFAVASKTLDTVYYNISSYTGTAANVNDISVELRPESGTGASAPDTAVLTEGKTSNPASATGWIAVTGWTSVIAALARVFICVGDADGNGTDYANINSRTSSAVHPDVIPFVRLMPVTTTGGFASGNTTSSSTSGMVVLKFSDGSVLGVPFVSSAAPGSSTNQRGLRITASGLIAPLKIFGVGWTTANSNISGAKLYTGSNGPASGATITSTDMLWGTGTKLGALLLSGGAPYQMEPGTAYTIVTTFGTATTAGPVKVSIGTGADATLSLAMPGGGEWYWREESGGAWSDDTTAFPGYALLLDGWVAPSGGSGGGGNPIGLGTVIKGLL